jgi:hypothetical protein
MQDIEGLRAQTARRLLERVEIAVVSSLRKRRTIRKFGAAKP